MIVISLIISRYAFITQSIATSYLHTNAINNAQLSLDPDILKMSSSLVRQATASYLRDDPTLAGPLLRLAFHDATTREKLDDKTFSGGANGSIRYEVDWQENRGISRPLKIVENIYSDVEECLSFADCISLCGAQAVESAGGPKIPIKLGRTDVTKADSQMRRTILKQSTDRSLVDRTMPSAGLDSDGIRLYFGALGLSEMELVALCGAHDLGRHVTLIGMQKSCLKDLTRACLEDAPVLMPFISEDPDGFSNTYFQKLLLWYDRSIMPGEVAFIPTDVDLVVDEGLREYVELFANDKQLFYTTFTTAYQKLVDVGNNLSDKRY